MLSEYARWLSEVLRNYAQALRRGMRHSALAVSRMLALWLEFCDLQVLRTTPGPIYHHPWPPITTRSSPPLVPQHHSSTTH